jgi:hypothetical protein
LREKKSMTCKFHRPPLAEATLYWVALPTLSISADIGKVVKIELQTRVLTVQHLLRRNGYEEFRFVEASIPFDHPDLVWSRLTESIEIVGDLPFEIVDAAISLSETTAICAQQLIESMVDDFINSTSEEVDSEESDLLEYTYKWSYSFAKTFVEESSDSLILESAVETWTGAKKENDDLLNEAIQFIATFALSEVVPDVITQLLTDCFDAIAISVVAQNIIMEIVDSIKISPKLSTTIVTDFVHQQRIVVTTTDEAKFEDEDSTVASYDCIPYYVDDHEENPLVLLPRLKFDDGSIESSALIVCKNEEDSLVLVQNPQTRHPVTLAGKQS